MSKRKPTKVFVVSGPLSDVTVLARHAKGARTVASEHMDGLTVANSRVRELDTDSACKAVNWKSNDSD